MLRDGDDAAALLKSIRGSLAGSSGSGAPAAAATAAAAVDEDVSAEDILAQIRGTLNSTDPKATPSPKAPPARKSKAGGGAGESQSHAQRAAGCGVAVPWRRLADHAGHRASCGWQAYPCTAAPHRLRRTAKTEAMVKSLKRMFPDKVATAPSLLSPPHRLARA